MNKKRLIITSVISIVLVAILMISSTYSVFTSSEIDEEANVYKTGNLDVTYTLSENNITLTSINPVNANHSCQIAPYQITITNNGNVPYQFNVILDDTTAGDKINYSYIGTQVGKYEVKSLSDCTDRILKEGIIVPANSSVTVDVRVFVLDTIQNTEIGKSFYAKLSIDGIAVYADENVDNSNLIADTCANKPNLDNGNLIPVYYDDTSELWRKADSTNLNNSWYDYDNKKWANAVLIKDDEDGIIKDLSGNNNHGTIYGATMTSNGLSFDGVDDYIAVDGIEYNSSKAFTIDFIAKVEEPAGEQLAILFESSVDSNSNVGGFYVDTNEGGTNDLTLAMKWRDTEDIENHKMVNNIIDTNQFKHYTITFDSTKAYDTFIDIYSDGTGQNVIDWSDDYYSWNDDVSNYTISDYPFYIGSRAGSEYFTKMTLKKLRIYNRRLTAEEITSNQNGNIITDGLILNYDFLNSTQDYYEDATTNTIINDSDILAFYTWIPRYKYRVWNITRQGGDETTYAYPAYTYGIDIEWENSTRNTGNVECTYNINSVESDTNLSDVCVYNKTDTITTESGNTNYKDAWYTHPAFTFGDKELEGFWIGKFETTGTAESPTVLPNLSSLGNQNVSSQFTTSKVFQNYLSNNIDAHMLTNLEWGAVAYLSHSIYGLCDGENSCRDVYKNNSSGFYTGRSAGVLTQDSSYSTDGTYDYKGYLIGDLSKDITKVASTTGNITGVYDMSGGAWEYVMGNMLDTMYAGDNWNGSSTLDSKYYNSYSYGEAEINQMAFNRARLGDATAEVVGNEGGSYQYAWRPGIDIIGAGSGFVTGEYSYFMRGCDYYNNTATSSFTFSNYYGDDVLPYSFRSSLS